MDNNNNRPQKEKYSGIWNGREVRFNREVRGYRLTDDECERLLDGNLITLHLTSRAGKPYSCSGILSDMEYNGHKYVGVEVLFIPDHWGGHTFTDAEKKALAYGKEVLASDCISKRTGKKYSVRLSFGEENGQMRIIPNFDR